MEEAIARWRDESDLRAKCNEQWRKHHHLFEYLIKAIKSEVSEDLIRCMEYVETLPSDCGAILAMDSYVKHLPARILLSEILEVFERDGDFMTLVKLFIVEMIRNKW
jgi:hypothetical protein